MAFIIGLGTAAYLLKALNVSNLQDEQDRKTQQALKEAKVALIAWAVSHPNHPGIMPFPDRNDDLPQGYDGKSDCVTVGVAGSHLIGMLPRLSDVNCVSPHVGVSVDGRDATGERLWYSVSINLVRMSDASATPVINPGIVNAPSNPWFVVRDRNGVVISNRVAAVIIAPSTHSGTQDRSSGIANANQYLDKIVMADGTPYQNYGYQDAATNPIQEFIIGDDLRVVSETDPTYKNQAVEPYYYNDKLIYITIDELMAALSSRAAAEAKVQLLNYKKSTAISSPPGYYPNASALVSNEYYQKNAQYAGFLPIQQPIQTSSKSCSVNYATANASSATCDFSSITNVEFTRTSGTFTGTTGTECTRVNSNKTCSCAITSGNSRCNGAAGRRFICTTGGCSTTGNLPGTYVFNGVFNGGKANSSSGACTGCGLTVATCSYNPSALSGSFAYDVTTTPVPFNSATTNSVLPAWFTANNWQDYLYYAVSTNCTYGEACDTPNIKVGDKPSMQAMIATTGAPIISEPFATKGSAQTHSGCDVKDYLDSVENTNLDTTFEANNKQRAGNYNDQTFVVHYVQP